MSEELRFDQNGGVLPNTRSEAERAKHADLITFPKGITGVTCANCSYRVPLEDVLGQKIKGAGYCQHPEVDQPVTPKMCCNYWSLPGTLRSWKRKLNS